MKTFTADFLSKSTNPNGVAYQARLRLFPGRIYINALNSDNASSAAQNARIRYATASDYVLPQASSYDSVTDQPISLLIDNGDLQLFTSGSAPETLASGVPYQRPGLRDHNYAYVDSGNNMHYGLVGGSTSIIDNAAKIGASHVVDYGVVTLYYDEGGVSVRLALSDIESWTIKTSPHRFMDPGAVWPTGQLGIARLNYSACTRQNNRIYIYLTMPDGHVEGLSYDVLTDMWGDYFTAIPADLTAFYVTGGYTDILSRIHLVGQFVRTEEQNSGQIYNLDVYSESGFTFALDRFSLFSTLGYRLLPCFDRSGTKLIYYTDAGRWAQGARIWSIYGGSSGSGGNTPILTIDPKWIVSLSGTPGSSYAMQVTDSTSSFWRNSLITVGTPAELDISVDRGVTWERLDTCVIAKKKVGPLKHTIELELQNESTWRVADLSYPMYIEIQSKQAIYLPPDRISELFNASDSAGVPELFCTRFPNNSGQMGGSDSPKDHLNNAPVEIWSEDLIGQNSLTDYPTLPAVPFNAYIYGWSRTGIQDTNPNTTDSTPSTVPNDDFQPIFLIKRNGAEQTVVIPKSAAVSSICYPPETYDPTNARSPAGTCPVNYQITEGMGLVEGDELIKIGVLVSAPNAAYTPTYSTVYWIERIEIPNMVQYATESTFDELWEAEDVPEITGLKADTNKYLSDGSNGQTVIDTPYVWVEGNKIIIDTEGLNASGNEDDEIWVDTVFQVSRGGTSGVNVGTAGRLKVTLEYEILRLPNPIEDDTYMYNWVNADTHGHSPALTPGGTAWGGGNIHVTEGMSVGQKWQEVAVVSAPHATSFGDPGYFNIMVGGTAYALNPLDPETRIPGYRHWSWSLTILKVEWLDTNDTPKATLWQSGEPVSTQGGEDTQVNYNFKAKGKPSVLFAERPNYAFDFTARARYIINGPDSWAGVVGLASDAKNFVCARLDPTRLQIIKVRTGKITVLASMTIPSVTGVSIEMEHRHGDLYVYLRYLGLSAEGTQPRLLTSTLSYRWLAADGPMLADPKIMHVGVYSYLDVPVFRICGFQLTESDGIGVLPGCYQLDGSNPLNRFPDSGTVEIGGVKYTYTSKSPVAKVPRGPFYLRNSGNWSSHTNPLDGDTYGNENMCEFTYFDWTESRSAWNDYMMACSNGGNWKITDLEHRAFITTGGDVVRLRNRCRGYGPTCNNDDSVSISDRLSLTYGLMGVAVLSGDPQLHMEGSNCFLDQVNTVKLQDFFGVSGGVDTTVRDLLERICQMAGARAQFPGDKSFSGTLASEEVRNLYGV